MPAAVPSLDLLTYQIHMPVPSNAVPVPLIDLGSVRLWIWIGPTTLERRPRASMIRIRPDRALVGTVVTKPSGLRIRSFARSGARLPPPAARALAGKSTTIPRFVRLRPRKRRRPPAATVCMSLQTVTGQQRTEVIRSALERASAGAEASPMTRPATAIRIVARSLTRKALQILTSNRARPPQLRNYDRRFSSPSGADSGAAASGA